jgi:hypothetical protein
MTEEKNLFTSFDLPLFGGLSRMIESCIGESTPRPRPGHYLEASTPCRFTNEEIIPKPTRRTIFSQKRYPDSVRYQFNTHPKYHLWINTLQKLVDSDKDLSRRDLTLLVSALGRQYVKMSMSRRTTLQEHKAMIQQVTLEISELENHTRFPYCDQTKLEELQRDLVFKQCLLNELSEITTKERVVPHYAQVHHASAQLFRDILMQSTIDKLFLSAKALMIQVSNDLEEFLTSPDRLEDRKRVVDQIKASIPVKRHERI